jgi:hypothetical protein
MQVKEEYDTNFPLGRGTFTVLPGAKEGFADASIRLTLASGIEDTAAFIGDAGCPLGNVLAFFG